MWSKHYKHNTVLPQKYRDILRFLGKEVLPWRSVVNWMYMGRGSRFLWIFLLLFPRFGLLPFLVEVGCSFWFFFLHWCRSHINLIQVNCPCDLATKSLSWNITALQPCKRLPLFPWQLDTHLWVGLGCIVLIYFFGGGVSKNMKRDLYFNLKMVLLNEQDLFYLINWINIFIGIYRTNFSLLKVYSFKYFIFF